MLPAARVSARLALLTLLFAAQLAAAQSDAKRIDQNGDVQIPAMTVPLSELLTPAYRQDYLASLQRLNHSAGPLDGWQQSVNAFKVTVTPGTLGGVPIETIEPAAGVAAQNRNRVLINLHGSGSPSGWGTNSRAESVPMAALGKIKVVTVNYREVPDARFPAVSEDAANVYRELLKTYRPENIGIYGCSFGALLTAESLTWFQSHQLPRPGAAGLLCGGGIAATLGDSTYVGMAVTGRNVPTVPRATGRGFALVNAYFEGSELRDPLASPAFSLEVLAKFPPTLLVSGTRDHALSGVVFTHSQLIKAGVDAELHIWEGMRHAEFYNSSVPESKDTWNVIVSFFSKKLGEKPKGR
jgi:acetyl esterase/lipase